MNMEHFIRIAFWIFTLFFTLSGCKPTPTPKDYNIDFLRTEVTCPKDTILYSPKEVTPQCLTGALECVHKELFQTARFECEDKNHRIGQAVEALQALIETEKELKAGSVPTTSGECACEKWSEVPYKDFLKNYETLVQQVNAARNGR